jgi:hypothetical protein
MAIVSHGTVVSLAHMLYILFNHRWKLKIYLKFVLDAASENNPSSDWMASVGLSALHCETS